MSFILGLFPVIAILLLLTITRRLKKRLETLEAVQAKTLNRLELLEGMQDPIIYASTMEPASPAPLNTHKTSNTKQSKNVTGNQTSAATTTSSKVDSFPLTDHNPPRAFVFTGHRLRKLGDWLRLNWAIAVAAISLALGGVFMVQYGVEKGLLTPIWRVAGAILLGAVFVFAGEIIRRRFGDDSEGATQYLSSTFAGAGLMTLFAAILSAQQLYGLTTSITTLIGLILVSSLAIALGWLYGPVLTAVGIIGASAAPFLVGGQSNNSWILFYYFALLTITGLVVDSVKRWAWISTIVLIATSASATLLSLHTGDVANYLAFLIIALTSTVIIPVHAFLPAHMGTTILATFKGIKPRADFPTRLIAAMVTFVSIAGLIIASSAHNNVEASLALAMIYLTLVATTIWMHKAKALNDLSLVPGAAFLATIALQAYKNGPLFIALRDMASTSASNSAHPQTLIILTFLAIFASAMAFWRMLQSEENDFMALCWAIGSAVFAPALVFILQFLWIPTEVLGHYGWSIYVLAVTLVMAFFSDRTLRGKDGARRQLRTALFAVAALSMLSLALFIVLSQAALTLALSVVIVMTVWLDRKFDIAFVGIFTKIGLAVISYRLILNPGFFWATDLTTSWFELVQSYLITLGLLYGAWRLSVDRQRNSVLIAIEGTVWTILAVFLCVILQRFSPNQFGLLSAVWCIAMLSQIHRYHSSGRIVRMVRVVLASLCGFTALVLIMPSLTFENPLFSSSVLVNGPPILDSLALTYLPVTAALAFGSWKLANLKQRIRISFATIASLFAAFYLICEIRRLWRGPNLAVAGVTDSELYSYTIAMIIICVIVLFIAFAQRSHTLRKLAMFGIAVTIAKVFLVDISGLSGLLRVASFVGIGLSMAALSWFDKTMKAWWDGKSDETEQMNKPTLRQ